METTPHMLMFDPPHPGEFITDTYLEPFNITGRTLATRLAVSPSTIGRVLNRSSRVTPDMALRLSAVLGRSAESWLAMQDAHDLWLARQTTNLDGLQPAEFATTA
jgi:addiction module HigA family antidote